MKALDVVQLEVIRNALVAAAEEMGVTIWRTSRSSVVRDLLDYSTCVFDAEGKSVAQATCIPVHLNSMSSCLDDILRDHIPLSEWREGDLIITNDPYSGGQHLNDILTFKPAFVDGRLVGIAGVLVHHLDVGGGAPGSYYAGATEIYQEGFRIPPMRLDDAGRRNKEVIQLLLRNTREPANVGGDFASQLAALDIGVKGLHRITRRYGADRLAEACRGIRRQSEMAMRAMIRDIPDGTYSFEDFTDDDGIERDKAIKISVKLTVRGDTVEVDFSGSSPQVQGPVNCTRNMSGSGVFCGILMSIGSEIPANAGCYEPVRIVAPDGLCVTARSPAPVANRMAIGHRVVNAVMGAFAKAIPGRVPAAYYGVSYAYATNLFHADGRRQVYFDLTCGGWGGHPDGDGANGFSCGLHNIANAPVEMLESTYPVTFEAYTLVPDSGGAGEQRGGCGLIRAFRIDAPAGTLSCNFDRFKTQPYGLAGGAPGAASFAELQHADGSVERLPSKVAGKAIAKGDVFRLVTSGGGGYGEPAKRAEAAIREDIENGYVSRQEASAHYGVKAG
ncbi:hydantoinase B/oxoprolinase family protein [Hyphomicrobium sp. CS1BSMeth3]|uniref:hydantoinase B/oxoprolinase family protein n=1 Tax=Hyphomicrobium sp. CS1BSMeth3 TaxID=1892844 RepID=UPI0009309BAA|nr:hydantoinase B/oxoprolinase family protein [Hyphomicrobium sp. CS1BSMeth3]